MPEVRASVGAWLVSARWDEEGVPGVPRIGVGVLGVRGRGVRRWGASNVDLRAGAGERGRATLPVEDDAGALGVFGLLVDGRRAGGVLKTEPRALEEEIADLLARRYSSVALR